MGNELPVSINSVFHGLRPYTSYWQSASLVVYYLRTQRTASAIR